jgi:hypothetical protein
MMKKIQFWSLLVGLCIGSLAFVACGDDDKDTSSGGNVSAEELLGSWYIIYENSSKKVGIDYIQIPSPTVVIMTEMKAKADNNWQLEFGNPIQSTYNFDGKRFTIANSERAADITKVNGKYMLQRYENGNAVGTAVELVKCNSSKEAQQLLASLVASKTGGDIDNPDDDDDDSAIDTTTKIPAEDLIGCWYLIDTNTSSKVCVDVITFLDANTLSFVELNAKSKYNWIPQDEDQKSSELGYTFDGRTIVILNTQMSADVFRGNSNYFIQRYENGKVVGSLTQLVRVKSQDEAAGVFTKLIAEKYY